jgi:putative ABC transport system permease protein
MRSQGGEAMMRALRQTGFIIAMGLRSLPSRLGSSLVVITGTAGAMAVLLSVLAVGTGLGRAMQNAGRDDRAVVLRGGSSSELASTISVETAARIADAPGVRRDAGGAAMVSPEVMALVSVTDKRSGSDVSLTFRGVTQQAFAVRPEIRVTQGRLFRPGTAEAIVGRAAQKQFAGLEIGNKVSASGQGITWTIVGVFESGGDSRESEILADAALLLSNPGQTYQSVTVLLQSPGTYGAFRDAMTSDTTFSAEVQREREYLGRQSAAINRLLFFMVYGVGGIMVLGAVFAAINSMYSAVSTRVREIATLRAIGFGGSRIVLSVLTEGLLLAALGGLLGALLAWVFFNGRAVSTAVGAGLPSQLAFQLQVTGPLFVTALVTACVIGLVGGLLPALRAARVPVTEALRTL